MITSELLVSCFDLIESRGLPLGVQVVAKFQRDHVSIAVAQVLDKVFGGWRPPLTLAKP